MAWQQPKTNWDTHPKAIEPADMNRIEGNILAVREQNNMALRLEVVSSFPSHAPGRAIYHTGNKMAYVSDGNNWMPFAAYDRGAMVFTPTTDDQTIPEGYHNGQGYVKGDENLLPKHIRRGISLFGIAGDLAYEERVASDTVRVSADSEMLTFSYLDRKVIRVAWPGSYRVTFEFKMKYPDWPHGADVRLIGGSVDRGYTTYSSTYEKKTRDITITPGDSRTITLRGTGSGQSIASVRNFRVGYDIVREILPLDEEGWDVDG